MSAIEIACFVIYVLLHEQINAVSKLSTIQTISIFVITWASGLFEFWCARQRVEYHYKALAALTLGFSLAQPISGIIAVLAFPNSKVDARVFSMALVQLISFGWIFFLYLRRGRTAFDQDHWIHALKLNLPLIPHYLSQSLLNTSDRIMIRSMVSASAAGIYGLSYSISFLMTIVNQAILNTMNPWMYQQIKNRDYDRLARVTYIVLIGVVLANLLVVCLAPEVISVFAPPEYREGIWLVPPLAATVVVMFLYSVFAAFEFYFERSDLIMRASIIGAVLNLVLNWMLIPRLGYQAAAWTTLTGYLVYVGMHYTFMRKIQRYEMGDVQVYSMKVILGILAAFALSASILTVLYPHSVTRYAICAIGLLTLFVKREVVSSVFSQLREKE